MPGRRDLQPHRPHPLPRSQERAELPALPARGHQADHVRTIAPDGKAGLGRPKAIVSVTQEWEGSNVEAPTLVWNAGQNRFYLFYSGGYYKLDSYAVGVSRSRTADPMGDWDKYPQRPRYKDSYPGPGPGTRF